MRKDPIVDDAELIADFLKASHNQRVFIICQLYLWDAFNYHFREHFADSPYHRIQDSLIANIKEERNFIRHLIDAWQLRGKQLDKNTFVVFSLRNLTLIAREYTFQLIEMELKPRGCSIMTTDY